MEKKKVVVLDHEEAGEEGEGGGGGGGGGGRELWGDGLVGEKEGFFFLVGCEGRFVGVRKEKDEEDEVKGWWCCGAQLHRAWRDWSAFWLWMVVASWQNDSEEKERMVWCRQP